MFGWTIDERRSFAVLDAYAEAGGNFIDTADIYGRRGPDGAGSSERIIGRWLAERGRRSDMVIATKLGMSREHPGLSRESIRRGIEGSLERLGIDRVDLYYAHEDDPNTTLEKTLETFQELIDEGLIRRAGASNYSAERLSEALELSRERDDLASYTVLQPHYNLLERSEYEGELAEICEREGVACVPYYGLARGFLTGKYRRDGEQVESPRAVGIHESYFNDRGFAVLDALDEIAAAHSAPVAAVALAWLASRPTVAAPIASATSPEQLADLMTSREVNLSAAQKRRLDEVSGGA